MYAEQVRQTQHKMRKQGNKKKGARQIKSKVGVVVAVAPLAVVMG